MSEMRRKSTNAWGKLIQEKTVSRALPYLWFFLITVIDIMVVEGYYRPTQLWSEIWRYHLFVLWPVIISYGLATILTSGIKSAAIYAILFISGLEDTLFYALQGYIPAIYYGVHIVGWFEPPVNFVAIINLLGLAYVGLIELHNN